MTITRFCKVWGRIGLNIGPWVFLAVFGWVFFDYWPNWRLAGSLATLASLAVWIVGWVLWMVYEWRK